VRLRIPLVGIFNYSLGNSVDRCRGGRTDVLYEIKEDEGRSILKHEPSHSMKERMTCTPNNFYSLNLLNISYLYLSLVTPYPSYH
jgi:hypothetical protein